MSNLYSAIQASFRSRPDTIVLEAGSRQWTAARLDAWVGTFASALKTLGLQPGDRIAVQVEKSAENIALYLGALRIGAIYVPLNTAYVAREIDYFLRDASPRVVIIAPERLASLNEMARSAGVEHVMTLGANGDGSLIDLVAQQHESAQVVACNPDDLAVICYTSGTTGRSKGASTLR